MSISVESLADRERIKAVIYTYCQGVDRCQWDKVRDCFTDSAHHDHGTFAGDNDAFITFAAEVLEQMDSTLHHIGNILIDLDGESATSEASFVAYHKMRKGADGPLGLIEADTDWIVAGRYCDRWQKTGEDWHIVERRAVHDWTRTEPSTDG
ncbi:MAG: nuclear transport factor 2 family protein [Pseudomonadota bacterium]